MTRSSWKRLFSPLRPEPLRTLVEQDVLDEAHLRQQGLSKSAIDSLVRLEALKPERDKLRVNFVGVGVAEGHSFQFLPKVASEISSSTKTMRHVVRALRRYSKWRPSHHPEAPFLTPTGDSSLSVIAISDWLIRDYLNAGLYRRIVGREQWNGAGQTSWRSTIERVAPIFSNRRPYYPDVLTRSAIQDNAYFISRLHRYVVETAADRFGHLLGYAPFNLDHEPVEAFDRAPPRALCEARVSIERRQAYTDRAIRLLPMVIAFLRGIEASNRASVALYGTTTFHHIWEAVCSQMLGNDRSNWQSEIPKPVWTSSDGFSAQAATFEPDIVTNVESDTHQWLLIADAKYYSLSMPPTLGGQPGVNDVAKQVWYEDCLTQAAQARGYDRISNIFVVPGEADEMAIEGNVTLGPSKPIIVTRLGFLSSLDRYAGGSALAGAAICAALNTDSAPN